VSRLVSAELLKLRTTRTAYGFLAATALLTLLLQGVGYATSDFASKSDLKQSLAGAGVATALLFVLGIVATTGEYRHNTITSSVLTTPDRRRLVLAKALAYALTGAFLGLVAMAVSLAVGIPWLSSRDISLDVLDAGDYAGLVAGGVVAAALAGAVGVGIGTIVRNQVAAVVGTLVYMFMLEPTVSLISDDLYDFTLGGTIGAVSSAGAADALDPIPAALVLLAWVVGLGLLGATVEQQRDVV
jgi:ABC-2 type transport system permease protein